MYQSRRPVLSGRLLVASGGGITRGLDRKQGQRLHEVRETVAVLLHSAEAERYTLDPKYWGTLPAWCRECRERWLDLDVLRRSRGTLRV
jgi:hypothetical protein